MTQVTTRVLYINQPDPGRKYGSIKTEIGYIGVPASQMAQFQRGGEYTIEYKERTFNGKVYKDFVSLQSERKDIPAPRANGASAPRGASNDMLMFVTGVVGRSMGSGQFGKDQILDLTVAAKTAYEACFMPSLTGIRPAPVPSRPRPIEAHGGDPRDEYLADAEPDYGDPNDPPFG